MKTLEDLEHMEDLKHSDSKLVYSWKLRASAIEWVKELNKRTYFSVPDCPVTNLVFNEEEVEAMKWIIKHFFNLDEDLK